MENGSNEDIEIVVPKPKSPDQTSDAFSHGGKFGKESNEESISQSSDNNNAQINNLDVNNVQKSKLQFGVPSETVENSNNNQIKSINIPDNINEQNNNNNNGLDVITPIDNNNNNNNNRSVNIAINEEEREEQDQDGDSSVSMMDEELENGNDSLNNSINDSVRDANNKKEYLDPYNPYYTSKSNNSYNGGGGRPSMSVTSAAINKEAGEHTQCEEFIYQFVQVNAILQLLLDIVLEVLHLVPMRVNHLALTTINAFLAYKTLSAIKQNKFKFLHEDIQILVLLEICLVFGDLFILIDPSCAELKQGWSIISFYYARLTFIVLSLYNLFVALYIMNKYKLYHLKYVGDREQYQPRPSQSVATALPSQLGGINGSKPNINNGLGSLPNISELGEIPTPLDSKVTSEENDFIAPAPSSGDFSGIATSAQQKQQQLKQKYSKNRKKENTKEEENGNLNTIADNTTDPNNPISQVGNLPSKGNFQPLQSYPDP